MSGSAGAGGGLEGERAAWAVLASAAGVGPSTFGSLVRRFGSAGAVLEAAARPGAPDLRTPPPDPEPGAHDPFRDHRVAGALVDGVVAARRWAPDLLERIVRTGIRLVTSEDDDYPARLRTIELAPPVLYVAGAVGSLRSAHAVAVVGTRRPSEAGRLLASHIARELVATGATVVSGLAVGIDGAAHAATLDEGGVTVAVLGSGHAKVSPRAHRGLATRIVEAGGAVASEFAPDMAPTRATFPRRNRIVSGLADATVVVEAGLSSGALITARWALEQGRECFVVPGPVGVRTSAGSLAFLREHAGLARIVAGVPELIEDLGLDAIGDAPGARPWVAGADLGTVERLILGIVDSGVGTVDQLVGQTGLATATVLAALTRLELRGLVVPVLGRYRPAGSRRSTSGTYEPAPARRRSARFAGRR